MIKCWFNEHGFVISATKGSARLFVEDEPEDAYTTRWYMFGYMLDTILADGSKINEPVIICHDSRLVEELKNELEPLTDYAKDARSFFLGFDSHLMPYIQIKKVSSHIINDILRDTSERNRLTEASEFGK